MRLVAAFFAIALVAATASVMPSVATPARAEGIEVKSQTAQNRFPEGVNFTVFASSNAEITSVRLRYRFLPDGTVVFGRPQCTTGAAVNCQITVGGSANAFLVPGVQVVYSWEIEDAAGQKLQTEQATFTYMDERFRWESISDGTITLNFYEGSDQNNQALLRTARETIDRMSRLLNTTVDFPVKVWVYKTSSDMRAAILSNRRIPPSPNNPTTLGEVVYSDTALVSRDTLPLDIVRHEVTHIVVRQATKGALGDPPAWVDEGTAVYAQNNLLPDELRALEVAIRSNRPLPIFSLSSSTLTQTDTSLFYAQAWSTVKFLIDTYGPEKYAQFVAAFSDDTTNGALKKVYGFDQNGLEDLWRKSVGLPAATAGAGGSAGREVVVPTLVPFGAQGQGGQQPTPVPETQPQAQAEDEDGGSSVLPIVIAVAVVAAVGAAGGTLYLRRRRATPPAG